MTDEPLPDLRYHPDPVATGAFEQIDRRCHVCERERGWIYVFGTYGATDLRDRVCPWCIADGSAAARFDVVFTEVDEADLPEAIRSSPTGASELIDRIQHRTPGFSAWQRERWLFHCDDAAAFLGPVGWDELGDHPDAAADVRRRLTRDGTDPADVDVLVGSLDVEGSATGYLFRCTRCGEHLAYADLE